ncbi:predicted protein [Plenodomus lingam JN3]|uniref:Predicted protein n=1 Tax=Leptosphaeria maculans (strain JN3 / isolate v23.1.3 / race Av1-4-5-6-7-8) TaxID=985895 RepID=E5AAN7_LEPMJ|nr:predicted protein [Plenodomus lingam JN3]CBY00728.1 predicted protein [Plenodomus lingam JN3]
MAIYTCGLDAYPIQCTHSNVLLYKKKPADFQLSPQDGITENSQRRIRLTALQSSKQIFSKYTRSSAMRLDTAI